MFMRLRERKLSILEVNGRMEAKACVTSRGSAPVKEEKPWQGGLIAALRLGCGGRNRRDICVAARPSIETER